LSTVDVELVEHAHRRRGAQRTTGARLVDATPAGAHATTMDSWREREPRKPGLRAAQRVQRLAI